MKISVVSRWRTGVTLAAAVAVLAACGGGPSDVVGGARRMRTPPSTWSPTPCPSLGGARSSRRSARPRRARGSASRPRTSLRRPVPWCGGGQARRRRQLLYRAGRGAAGQSRQGFPEWNSDVTKGIPFGSVVTLVVRKGNPKNIKDWDDLLKPGVEVVTPSPLSSGSAKWNLLAPYAAKSDGGKNQQAGLDFVRKLVSDHVRMRPSSGREAADVFPQGSGDVLVSYENEAINIERQGLDKEGGEIEHLNPPQTFKIESPVAVVTTTAHLVKAVALKNFLFTTEGQRIWAQAGFRPVDPGVAAEFAKDFPVPQKLWTIADLGGWTAVDAGLFDKENGAITAIYKKATG